MFTGVLIFTGCSLKIATLETEEVFYSLGLIVFIVAHQKSDLVVQQCHPIQISTRNGSLHGTIADY